MVCGLAPGKMKKYAFSVFKYIMVFFIIIWTLAPIFWLFLSSIFPYKELLSDRVNHWFPSKPTFKHYASFFDTSTITGQKFVSSLLNSITVALVTTVVCLFFGTLAAYVIVRLEMRLKKTLVLSLMIIRMLPTITLVIPFFIIVRQVDFFVIKLLGTNVHLYDSKPLLVTLYCSFILGFVIWLMRGFFLTIPKSIEDAARIDGLTRFQTIFRIILPLSANGLAATGILAFLLAWDEFLLALIFTRTEAAKTLPLYIAELGSQYIHDFTQISAAGVVACIPPFLLVLIFQRFIVAGLTMGGTKE